MGFDKLKAGMIPWLLGCGKAVLEKLPEMTKEAAPVAVGAAAAAVLAPTALPLAILAPPLIEQVAKRYENRPDAEALSELYRESLLHAIESCRKSLEGEKQVTEDDRTLLDLWCEGLSVSAKNDPFWARMLDEELPTGVVRLISVDLTQASTYWPLLRAILERWGDWFRYRRTAGKEAIAITIPHQPLGLSEYLEAYLAANLPPLLLEEFRPELTGAEQGNAFRQALLAELDGLSRAVTPLDPLKPITDFPTARNAIRETQLLDARFRAVPYIGREVDLDALWNWLNDPAPVSFQVIAGRGGSGKTRIAYRLLELLEKRAPFTWHAGVLEPQRFADSLSNERFRRWRGRCPTLIVIDYAATCAERLQQYVVPELSSYCTTADANAPPLRFLLLERGADERQGWYASLLRAAGTAKPDLFPNGPLRLAPLDGAQRLQLLNAVLGALHRFESRGRSAGMVADSSLLPRLSAPRMEDPLVLAMAAMAAHERGNLDALDLDRIDLAKDVAAHEYRRLERLAQNVGKSDFLLLHLAAYITLTGRLEESGLQAACIEEKGTDSAWSVPDLCAILVTRALPGVEARFAEPITPDIVGEAFILGVLRQAFQDASGTVVRAASRRPGPVAQTLVRLIQDFGPQHDKVRPEDEENQKWALELLTHLLHTKAEVLSDELFGEIDAALPLETTVMLKPARDFYLAAAGQKARSAQVHLAALNGWSIYEGKLGNAKGALRLAETAVSLARRWAALNRAAFLPDLAKVLNNFANRQSEMGQLEAALQSIEEGAGLYRELAASSDAFLPNLGASLNTLAARQREMGQPAAALQSSADAVRIRRELVTGNRDLFLADLAGALTNQAAVQSDMGQQAAALHSNTEAVRHYRDLVARNRDAFLPNLAKALNNLAAIQGEMGQHKAALGSIEEAVRHVRELVEAIPKAFLPDLAVCLIGQSSTQRAMGQPKAAMASIVEAVKIRRELAAANRARYLPNLAAALNNLANLQRECEAPAAALFSITEAVKLRRELAAANPNAFLPELVNSLGAWGSALFSAGDARDAVQKFAEAIRLISPLAQQTPEAYLPLARQLAQAYIHVAAEAGITVDPALTWPIELDEGSTPA